MHFLDVKTDYAFKRVFGSEGSKPLLIGFLNAMLDYRGEYAIVDLSIVDPYQIPMLKGMKDTFVDVKAILANRKQLIIEMQVLNVPGFEKRILH
ncbi:Rpn family recombination-promoting nuclease/putative transposase, partial [bacterium]|nr:Rpn family recombination-promoting nuclease/putative transposase [bacterium]